MSRLLKDLYSRKGAAYFTDNGFHLLGHKEELMRALSLSVALAALLVWVPTHGVAQTDLSGDWIFEIHSEPGEPGMHLRLVINVTQVDQALTATGVAGYEGAFQVSGSLDESEVQLIWEPIQTNGTPLGLSVTGTVEGDYMSGSALFDVGERVIRGEWSATRRG